MKKPIEVFYRHCYYSRLQELPDRGRPEWFNKIKVFENFKNTLDPDLVNYTIVYDEFYGGIEKTFLASEKNVKIVNHGSECESFLSTLDLVQSRNFDDDQIIYFLEDDYLHRPGWCDVLMEGFTVDNDGKNPSYVTMYDFDWFIAKGFLSEIFFTKSTHWRATAGTTNTYACKYKTLIEDLDVHKKYSSEKAIKEEDGFHFSKDYDKFYELTNMKRFLISSIPGWSTHCDVDHLSPVIDWEQVMNSSYRGKKQKQALSLNYK